MIIDCFYCQSRVDAILIGENEEMESNEEGPPVKIVFLKCPVCNNALLGISELYQVGRDSWEWSKLTRLWPKPDGHLHYCIPKEVRSSLEEAKKCYQAKAFSACAVMCGRAIEAMCVLHSNEKTLYKGLQKLRDMEFIDGRLFDWGESLRQERNIGAHATGQNINKEDVRDILDFAIAICEYVYVLSDKYESYKKRKSKSALQTK